MAGIVANYIFAYGFVTDIRNTRYFRESDPTSDMETVNAIKRWKHFLNEVGWYHSANGVSLDEQSKLYVFGERILAVEDGTFSYISDSFAPREIQAEDRIYDLERHVFDAELKYKEVIESEAKLNDTNAGFLFFMHGKERDFY